MFTKANIRNGSTYLAVHLSANDYYCQGERIQGQWLGKLAEKLGLAGNEILADDAAFENLRLNLTPDGKAKLTSKHPEIRFYDFQCSAQKSVSIMAVTMGDDRLVEAHRKAFEVAFIELERSAAARIRAGVGYLADDNRITGNVCAAVFHHDASRALDPQIHTHAVIVNATFDPVRGRIQALTDREMARAIRYAGKVYQNELACNVRELGYEIDLTRKKGEIKGFEIRGVSPEICERFSKRRKEIEAGIEEFKAKHGHEPSPDEIHAITVSTRTSKLAEISTSEVRRKQREQLSGLDQIQLEQTKRSAFSTSLAAENASASLKRTIAHLFERNSVLPMHQIVAEALNQGLGSHRLADIYKHFEHVGVVALTKGEPTLLTEYATVEGLRQENWCKDFINGTRNRFAALEYDFSIPHLRQDQLEAARLICTCRDQVCAVRGVAGAGKTYMLKAVHAALKNEKVYYIAPTANAAKIMRADGLANATTCSDFLQNIARKVDLRGAIVICDEAGLQSNKQGYALLQLARENEMRVRFVGDSRQHTSVEAGDFLRVMERHSKMRTVEVTTIERQQHRAYREAIIAMADGAVRSGLEKLDRLGWVTEGKGDYIANAAGDYLSFTSNGRDLDSCVAVSPTWAENHRLTEEIRSGLKRAGILATETEAIVHHSLKWTQAQKETAANYEPGQIVTFNERVGSISRGKFAEVSWIEKDRVVVRFNEQEITLPLPKAVAWDVAEPRQVNIAEGDKILIRANARELGLTNGDVLRVERITPDGTLHCRGGKQIPITFGQWTHGYVLTSYKAQGATATRVVVAAAALNQKAAYVACSRGRQECRVHTPNKQRLWERLPEGNRKSPLEVQAANASESIAARSEAWQRFIVNVAAIPAKILARVRQHVLRMQQAVHVEPVKQSHRYTQQPAQQPTIRIKI